jgi:hypothetical protein
MNTGRKVGKTRRLVRLAMIHGMLVWAALGLMMGALLLIDYARTRPDASWPIVEGTVTERRMVRVNGFADRTRLTVRIGADGPLVYAMLAMDAGSSIPDHVTFRYGGAPSREVALMEETSSLYGGLLLSGMGALALLLWLGCMRYRVSIGEGTR